MTLAGVLRADAAPGASGVALNLDVDDPARGGVTVTVLGEFAGPRLGEWRAGRRVRIPAHLRRPSRYLDPGVPDFERALARRGTTLVGTVKSGALVDVEAHGNWTSERLADVRAFARQAITRSVGRWHPVSAAIVTAIVIGDRAGLDGEVQRKLQEAGTYHVIAISGGNIAILAGLMLAAYRVAGVLGRTAMLSSIVTLLAYEALVGGGASVDRATLMAAIVFAARAFDQRSPPLNTFAVAATLLVAANPLSIADPAFLLTCGATLAILLAVPLVKTEPGARVIWKIREVMWTMFVASFAAEAMLFPVGAWLFSRITFAGLLLNFFAIPLMGVAQIAGMVVVPLALISTRAAAGAGWVAHLGAAGLVWSADVLTIGSHLSYRVARPSAAVAALYYGAGIVAWALWRRRVAVSGSGEAAAAGWWRRTAAGVALVAACWILVEPWAFVAVRGDGRLHVTFIDVGQGDSAFVRLPHGAALLVDAGGLAPSSSFDLGDRVVAPVLREAGVRRLDILALSHGDPDHIGGAGSIVREFGPREVWEGIPVPGFAPLNQVRQAALVSGARWANVYTGDRLVLDEVEIVALHPDPADWERRRVRNDDSLVVELRWRNVSVVLTGDIGKAVERGLRMPPARLRLMKVPHHGSLTSSAPEFLAALQARVAVVSVGRGNHFGHPAQEVLQRYRDVGAEVFRTDRDGAVTVDTDGTSLDVHTFTGRRVSLR